MEALTRELFDSLPKEGWLSWEEACLLWSATQLTEGPILEVGCYYGRSTCLLAALGRAVCSVDPFANFDSDDPSGERVKAAWIATVIQRGLDNAFLSHMPIESFQSALVYPFAYLDGDHTYQGTLNQINAAIRLGAERICLHDYEDNGGGREIVRAVADSPLEVIEVAGRMAHCRVTKGVS